MASPSLTNVSSQGVRTQVDVTDAGLESFARKALLIAQIALPLIEVTAFLLVIALGSSFPPFMVVSLIVTGVASGVGASFLPSPGGGYAPESTANRPIDNKNDPSQQQNPPSDKNDSSSSNSLGSQSSSQQLRKSDSSSEDKEDEIVEEDGGPQQIQGGKKSDEECDLEEENFWTKRKKNVERVGTVAVAGLRAAASMIWAGLGHVGQALMNPFGSSQKGQSSHEVEMYLLSKSNASSDLEDICESIQFDEEEEGQEAVLIEEEPSVLSSEIVEVPFHDELFDSELSKWLLFQNSTPSSTQPRPVEVEMRPLRESRKLSSQSVESSSSPHKDPVSSTSRKPEQGHPGSLGFLSWLNSIWPTRTESENMEDEYIKL